MFEAVLFDCDGVLIDTENLALDLEVEFLKKHSLIYDRLVFAKNFIGKDSIAMRAEIENEYASQLGKKIPENLLDDMWAARDKHFAKNLTSIENAEQSLKAWQGKKAVASSSRQQHLKTNLTKTGLADLVYPNVYSAEQVARGKPHPDVFLFAAEKLGVNPEKCLVIEDSINGILAARSANMTVWGFLGGGHVWPELEDQLIQAGAHEIIQNHNELTTQLEKLKP